MYILEKGTPYTEQIDVDEKQGVEVFRVPAHNDVDAADFYHDFKMVRLVWTFQAGYRFACNQTVTPEFKREVSRLKRVKCFPSTLHWRNLKTQK